MSYTICRIGLEGTNQTKANEANEVQTTKQTHQTRHTTWKHANPYTLSPFGIETPKRQRGHLHTRGGSGREVVPLLLVLLVRLSGGDGLLDVFL